MSHLTKYLPQILTNMPSSWRGTTFNNSHLLGRGGFAARLTRLLVDKHGTPLSSGDLESLGEAEDYLRVASNISTLLEMVIAERHGLDPEQVFTFGSLRMPIIAVALATGRPVTLYLGSSPAAFSESQLRSLSQLRCQIVQRSGAPPPAPENPAEVVLTLGYQQDGAKVDGVVEENVLLVLNPVKISLAEILIRRKRMATPLTTPAAEAQLRALAGLEVKPQPPLTGFAETLAHLQSMSGADEDAERTPVCFTAGLPTVASLWTALICSGGADVVMASTAYGGSSQLTDLLQEQSKSLLKKHTFDLQGTIGMESSIEATLDACAGEVATLLPTTVLFVEVPTNPDQKVPDLARLAVHLEAYGKRTGRSVMMLIDTTFAPASHVLAKLRHAVPELNAVAFLSMSKSVSRGFTIAGGLVFNHTAASARLRLQVLEAADLFDTTARPDQRQVLADNHVGVEQRCQAAYQVAAEAGAALVETVLRETGHTMRLAFVTPETAAQGFTTATFSFNLPPLVGATHEQNEALAQRFVDLIVEQRKDLFKPCVSFGQDNGLVYATVPATSTQGAIKAEDKAKQAEGGVQLARLSFPPKIDVSQVNHTMATAIKKIYAK